MSSDVDVVPDLVESLKAVGQCAAGLRRDTRGLLQASQGVHQRADPAAGIAGGRCAAGRDQLVRESLQGQRELLQTFVHAEEAGRTRRAFWETGAVAAAAGVAAGAGYARFTETRTRAFVTAAQLCARRVTVTR